MPDNNKANNRCPYCGLGKEGFDLSKCGLPYCSETFQRRERWYNTLILAAGPLYVGAIMLYLHSDKWQEIGLITFIAMGVMFIIGRTLK
jgi:hypothetical protein